MGALSNNVQNLHYTYEHYTNTGNNINRKISTSKRFKNIFLRLHVAKDQYFAEF